MAADHEFFFHAIRTGELVVPGHDGILDKGIKDTCDFWAVNLYTQENLTRLMDKPVYITENGCSCVDDDFRIVYLVEYLCALQEAIRAGVDVKGYLYWSLLDNYEWYTWISQFGLVDVDRRRDFKRTPKPSAYFYKEIIENNRFSQNMLKKYLNKMPTTIFTNHKR